MNDDFTIQTATHERWLFTVEPSRHLIDCPIWFHLFAGPTSMGLHITAEQAESIGALFLNAAKQVKEASHVVQES